MFIALLCYCPSVVWIVTIGMTRALGLGVFSLQCHKGYFSCKLLNNLPMMSKFLMESIKLIAQA